jgi:ABC-type multidrug transport system fused ATPase/permease subunit
MRLEALWNTCQYPQGLYEPIICLPGYYCPPGGLERYICPNGYYCPLGSFEPIKCDTISSCPIGSSRQFSILGILILIIIDTVIFIALVSQSLWKRKRLILGFKAQRNLEVNIEVQISMENEEEMGDTNESLMDSHSMQKFINSLKYRMGTSVLGFEITFEGLGLVLPNGGKTILENVSGTISPKSLLAVMGASGSGKCTYPVSILFYGGIFNFVAATFIRLLMGKLKNTSGTIYINGTARGMSE